MSTKWWFGGHSSAMSTFAPLMTGGILIAVVAAAALLFAMFGSGVVDLIAAVMLNAEIGTGQFSPTVTEIMAVSPKAIDDFPHVIVPAPLFRPDGRPGAFPRSCRSPAGIP